MTEELDPKTFDIDAWLEDAHLPERSCTIFRGGHLVGDLDQLKAEIQEEKKVGDQTLSGMQRMAKLVEKYEAELEKFGASALTVYLSALPGPRLRELKTQFDELEKEKGWDRQTSAAEFWYALCAEAVVAVKPADGQRTQTSWTAENIKALDTKIGAGEFGKLKTTYQIAQSEVREPDADFLPNASGDSKDDTGG